MKAVKVYADDYTHYCGRKGSYKGQGIDASILGNPFEMKCEADRDRVCEQFRVYLNDCRKENNEVWQYLIKLPEDAVLACFCKPKRCHCDTIISAYEWHHEKNRRHRY